MGAYRRGSSPRPHLGTGVVCVCAGGVCVCGGVRPRYDVFRDYSGNLVYVESGQCGRPEILHDSPVLLGAFKKKVPNAITIEIHSATMLSGAADAFL